MQVLGEVLHPYGWQPDTGHDHGCTAATAYIVVARTMSLAREIERTDVAIYCGLGDLRSAEDHAQSIRDEASSVGGEPVGWAVVDTVFACGCRLLGA